MAAYTKAIAAGIVAGLTSIATALGSGSITAQDLIYAVIAAIVGSGIVAASPANKPKAGA